MVEDARKIFPSPEAKPDEKEAKLDRILSKYTCFSHVFLFDGKEMTFRSQPAQISNPYFKEERDKTAESYHTWFKMEGESMVENLHKRARPLFYTDFVKRPGDEAFRTTAIFLMPGASHDRVIIGGTTFDTTYLKQTFFPQMLDELINEKLSDQGGNRLAMNVYPAEMEGGHEMPCIANSAGWGDGKPEVSRKFEDVFRGLALGIKFQ